MADGARLDPRDDDAELAARAEDARLIRRVRWRLVAWSGLYRHAWHPTLLRVSLFTCLYGALMLYVYH